MSRTIYIGDVHGCLAELEELLDKLRVHETDEVIFVGDLLDKGPEGPACVALVRHAGFTCLLGNHEEKHNRFAAHRRREAAEPGHANPMSPPADFVREHLALSESALHWMEQLPVAVSSGDWIAVHGGLFPELSLEEQVSDRKLRDALLRMRWLDEEAKHVKIDYDDFTKGPPSGCCHWAEVYDGAHNVVYGHEAHDLRVPRVDRGRLGNACFGIDTGCVHGGHLTALVLERPDAWSFVQVQARETYAKPPMRFRN